MKQRTEHPCTRGQSEIISVVLLLFILLLGITAVITTGSSALTELRTTAETSAAESAFSSLDSEVSAVAFGGTSARSIDLGLDANPGSIRYDDSGWIRVQVDNETSASRDVVNESLGTVRYRQDETTVAVQGGGVWRRDGDGSVMLSRPEFHLRDKTLTVPIVSMDGDRGLTSSLQITPDGPPERRYPQTADGFANPPESGSVTVTVKSEYYEAWGGYFEDQTDAIVRYDHTAKRVTATFIVLPARDTFDAGVIATAGTGELTLAGNGPYVDSYNSSGGDYASTQAGNGEVVVAGDFVASGTSDVYGDVRSGGTVDLSGNTKIHGDVYWTDNPRPGNKKGKGKSRITGETERIDGVRSIAPIDTFVTTYAESVQTNNDNDDTTVVSDDELSITGGSGELTAGRYYLEHLTLDGTDLVLDTTDGDITIAVRDYVKLNGGEISVVGDGTVRLVVEGENDVIVSPTGLGSSSVNLHVGKGAAVDVPDEDAKQFRVYGTKNFNATIAASKGKGNGASFDGIIFAPAGEDGTGYVYVKQADLYGLVVTGDLTLGQYGAVHYDHGLKRTSGIRSPFSELERVHVAVHRVRVTSE